ncbi:putative bifunctional diguanylate cyclase/phosphodiesterase [Alteromonas sp. a30]|uniref:putative bifunctional diguanylate cyclase/phosphodiesterase n=1 Tax=Alteromonas sp. a30 TaxID=2730917 RepID=UPI0022800C11|nr:bifunctional diguanylate cyclase/phosphodiesterase [Alteromonas sp. a30]MCY7295863.1 EAL domain-containing protein [Alteromonas sp. a30]
MPSLIRILSVSYSLLKQLSQLSLGSLFLCLGNANAQESATTDIVTDVSNPYFWLSCGLISFITIRKWQQIRQQNAIDIEQPAAKPQYQKVQPQTYNGGENSHLLIKAINNTSDGVFIADAHYRIVYVNRAYLRFTGETKEQALRTPLQFNQYSKQFEQKVKSSLRQKHHWKGEFETVAGNGIHSTVTMRIDAILSEQDEVSHYVGVFSDITERKQAEQELIKLANVDPLTQLPNRTYFHTYQEYQIKNAKPYALLCLDLDNFKKINDTIGHSVGDQLLRQVATRVESLVRKNMVAFRLGGDEFAIIIEGTPDVHRLTKFSQLLLDKLANPYRILGQEFVVKASLGLAFYPNDGKNPQEIFKNADTAMYFAKSLGGNRCQFFQTELNQEAVKQLKTENLIRFGLQKDLFKVMYQPKVSVKTGQLCGMEALVRFEHPKQGLISPKDFIPMAEETGQILEIGERVLQMACSDTARWVNAGLMSGKVAINIAALQFKEDDFALQVKRILKSSGLSPKHLECEITEGTLIDSPDDALNVMLALRSQGVQLALDDFGTGYSSLAYLKRFPITTLKIDKAFIDDIDKNSTDKNMVEAIINIAHNLGLEVVAEGVETESQLMVLSEFGCEMLQGYLFSKPLSSDKFEKLLKAENLSRTRSNIQDI